MQFALFEPFIWDDINDYPDLGCAILVGACLKNNISIKLISSQRLFLKAFFKDFVDEMYDLFLLHKTANPLSFRLLNDIAKKGRTYFKTYLNNLYDNYFEKKWSTYLD
jgi:hypothetical protein